VTFAEFEQLPGERIQLHHGEVRTVPPPKPKHLMAEHRLQEALRAAAGDAAYTFLEFGFRVGDRNYRVADVAVVSRAVWDRIDPDVYFDHAPDIVVEILSPANTVTEMLDKEKLCLENGAREFWLVDLDRRQIKVSTLDGRNVTYGPGQEIPFLFGGTLAADRVLG
jgi:Uma2 family endonuclease